MDIFKALAKDPETFLLFAIPVLGIGVLIIGLSLAYDRWERRQEEKSKEDT